MNNIRKEMGKKLRSEIERNHNADIESKKLIKIFYGMRVCIIEKYCYQNLK